MQTRTVRGRHPTCPDVGRSCSRLKAEDHLFRATSRPRRNEDVIHRYRRNKFLVDELHIGVGIRRANRANKETIATRALEQSGLIETLLSDIISKRLRVFHQWSNQPLRRIRYVERTTGALTRIEQIKCFETNRLATTIMNQRLNRKRIDVLKTLDLKRILKRGIGTPIGRLHQVGITERSRNCARANIAQQLRT